MEKLTKGIKVFNFVYNYFFPETVQQFAPSSTEMPEKETEEKKELPKRSLNIIPALPNDCISLIFSFLPLSKLIFCRNVCKQWSQLAVNDLRWKKLSAKIQASKIQKKMELGDLNDNNFTIIKIREFCLKIFAINPALFFKGPSEIIDSLPKIPKKQAILTGLGRDLRNNLMNTDVALDLLKKMTLIDYIPGYFTMNEVLAYSYNKENTAAIIEELIIKKYPFDFGDLILAIEKDPKQIPSIILAMKDRRVRIIWDDHSLYMVSKYSPEHLPLIVNAMKESGEVPSEKNLIDILPYCPEQLPIILTAMKEGGRKFSGFLLQLILRQFPQHASLVIDSMEEIEYFNFDLAFEKCPTLVPSILSLLSETDVDYKYYFHQVLEKTINKFPEQIPATLEVMKKRGIMPAESSLVNASKRCPQHIPIFLEMMLEGKAKLSDGVLAIVVKICPEKTTLIVDAMMKRKWEPSRFILSVFLQNCPEHLPVVLIAMKNNEQKVPFDFLLHCSVEEKPEQIPMLIEAMQNENTAPSNFVLNVALRKNSKYIPEILDAMRKGKVDPSDFSLSIAFNQCPEHVPDIVDAMQKGGVIPSAFSLTSALHECPQHVPCIVDAMQKGGSIIPEYLINRIRGKYPDLSITLEASSKKEENNSA